MNPITGIYTTTVGKKILMAVTGIILVLYVVAHMLGNLQIYIGAEQIDAYARFLHSKPALLWVARSVLLFCVAVHTVAAVQLWLRNRASRPVKYRVFRPPSVDLAARTMVWSGPIVARLRRLPHPALHHRRRPSAVRGARSVPQRGHRFRGVVGGRHLHRRQPAARVPPLPRGVEPVPVIGLGPPAVGVPGAESWPPPWRWWSAPRTSRSRWRCSPASCTSREVGR